jgi:hypothetical protein
MAQLDKGHLDSARIEKVAYHSPVLLSVPVRRPERGNDYC